MTFPALSSLFRSCIRQSQRRRHLHPGLFFLEQILWPLILLISTYFIYLPFAVDQTGASPALTGGLGIWPFLTSGLFTLSLFLEYVNIGMGMAFERDFGMLEIVYLSGTPRLLWLTGHVSSSLISGIVGSLGFFSATVVLLPMSIPHPGALFLILAAILVLSLPWGLFIASIFLLGRNSRFLYALFETPAEFLSGVRFPVKMLPQALFGLSLGYPLTRAIRLVRASFSPVLSPDIIRHELGALCILAVFFTLGAYLILTWGEERGRRKGNLSFH